MRPRPFVSTSTPQRLTAGVCVLLASLTAPTALQNQAAADPLKVMSFNMWGGGGHAEAQTILQAGADIVGIQEGNWDTIAIANELGMQHAVLNNSVHGNSVGIVTRFDIVAEHNNGVTIDMGDMGRVHVFSVHLPSSPYQPYQLANNPQLGWGTPIDTGNLTQDANIAVAQAWAARGQALTTVLNEANAVAADGLPVLLMGDFNEPSHIDWTDAAGPNGAGLHTHTVAWPSSIAMSNAGFTDAFRELFPDEVATPGYTWTTLANDPEVHDRIDFVYHRNTDWALADVQLVGNSGQAGGIASDIVVSGYPSDHRAVLATFNVPEPASALCLGLLGVGVLGHRRRR